MQNELENARAVCCVCYKPIKDRPRRCDVCGLAYCPDHDKILALVRSKGSDVMYACHTCIRKNNLKVIDPNHPLYLCN